MCEGRQQLPSFFLPVEKVSQKKPKRKMSQKS